MIGLSEGYYQDPEFSEGGGGGGGGGGLTAISGACSRQGGGCGRGWGGGVCPLPRFVQKLLPWYNLLLAVANNKCTIFCHLKVPICTPSGACHTPLAAPLINIICFISK